MPNKLFTRIAALLVFSCAARQTNQYSSSSLSRNILTAQEISDSFGLLGSSTAYDLISKLRPLFLYGRGCKSPAEEPVVFLNGVRMVGEQKLARIAAMTIVLIEYYPPLDAEMRYGAGNPCGVIAITTNKKCFSARNCCHCERSEAISSFRGDCFATLPVTRLMEVPEPTRF